MDHSSPSERREIGKFAGILDKNRPPDAPKKPKDSSSKDQPAMPDEEENSTHRAAVREKRLDQLQDIADRESNRALRQEYAEKIYVLAKCWIAGVLVLLILSGFRVGVMCVEGLSIGPFYLSDGVLIALLTATGLLGLMAIILRNLFPSRFKSKEKSP